MRLRTANILRDLNDAGARDHLDVALRGVTVAGLQEVVSRRLLLLDEARKAALKVWQPRLWRGDQAIVWDPAQVEKIAHGSKDAHTIRRRRAFVWAAFRPVDSVETFAYVSGHWVAHIEARGLPRAAKGPRAVLYRLANRAYLRLVAELTEKYGRVYTAADTNVDQRLDDGDITWFTEAVLARAGQVSNWDLPTAPEGGSHGRRAIDIVAVPKGTHVTGQRVLRRGPGDHDVVEIEVDLAKEKPMDITPPAPKYIGPPAHHSGDGNKPINRVVIHSTVSPCVPGGAESIARYFTTDAAGGSAHYVVDPETVIQAAWDSVDCWHAPPDTGTLGIEMCDIPGPVPTDKPGTARWKSLRKAWRWIRPAQRQMLNRTARLTAHLCLAYDVPLVFLTARQLKKHGTGARGVTTHAQTSAAFGQSTHWDPGWWPRRRFMRLVRKHARQIKENHR